MIDAASFSVNDEQKDHGHDQSKKGDKDLDSELGAPDPAVYKSKSGDSADTLTDLRDRQKSSLARSGKLSRMLGTITTCSSKIRVTRPLHLKPRRRGQRQL